MQITDIYGAVIEVTDLDAAIKQAAAFKGYRHKDRQFIQYDLERAKYWTDIWQQLTDIKNKENGNDNNHI